MNMLSMAKNYHLWLCLHTFKTENNQIQISQNQPQQFCIAMGEQRYTVVEFKVLLKNK